MGDSDTTDGRALRYRRRRARRQRTAAREAHMGRTGLRLRGRGLEARGASRSDRFVFREIFGKEDAYRIDSLLPLMRGGTVVEVGAHKGYFTILAASVAERVLVFEPAARNYDYVLTNTALNELTNVTAVRAAVSRSAGVRAFTVSSVTDARHTFFDSDFSGSGTKVDVPCVTLPQALEEHEVRTVDVLKLDCEGSEYDALFACDTATLSRIRCVVAELHESPSIPHTRADLIAFLTEHGFTAEVYDEHARTDLRTCMAWFRREVER